MSAPNRILTGIFSTWASFLLTATTSLVMTPFLVHRLGNTGYGLWSLYMAITGYFTLLDFGVSPAIVRYTSRYQALGDGVAERRILVTGLAFFTAASAVVLSITGLGAAFYDRLFPPLSGIPLPVARATFLLVGLDFALTLPFAVFQGILLGHQQYLALNGLNIMLRLTRFGLVLALVGEGPAGLVTVASIFFLTGLGRDLGLFRAARRALGGPLRLVDFRRDALGDLLGYSLPAFVIAIALRVMAYTDSLVIGYAIGVGAVTYFALAASLVDYVQEIGWGLAGVLVPVVSGHEARGELAPVRARFLQFTRYCVWLMAPILAISMLLGRPFFTRWVGPDYVASAPILTLLMAAMAVYVVQMPGQAVLKGMSLHRRLAWFMALEALLNFVLSVILARRLGVVGVALGTLIPRVVIEGLLLPGYLLRVLELRIGHYLREGFLPVLPGAAGLALLSLAARRVLEPAPGWGMMVVTGLVYVATFAALTLALGATPEERAWVAARSAGLLARVRRLAGAT
jgi:O-antigen/teichoic acid export membrane protein